MCRGYHDALQVVVDALQVDVDAQVRGALRVRRSLALARPSSQLDCGAKEAYRV